jgi:hypothetical protein
MRIDLAAKEGAGSIEAGEKGLTQILQKSAL